MLKAYKNLSNVLGLLDYTQERQRGKGGLGPTFRGSTTDSREIDVSIFLLKGECVEHKTGADGDFSADATRL